MTSIDEVTIAMRRHAALSHEADGDVSVVVACEQPHAGASRVAHDAGDMLAHLIALNGVVNGQAPHSAMFPRTLVYAVCEVFWRMSEAEASQQHAVATVAAIRFWKRRLERAWIAVLCGDIEDIQEHINLEESSK